MPLAATLRHSFLLRALAAGLLVFGVLSLVLPLRQAGMLGWCANVGAYAALLFAYLGDADPDTMRRRAQQLAEGRAVVLTLALLVATASLLIVALLLATRNQGATEQVLSIFVIIAAWFYLHLLFAQEYAHEFWMTGEGLDFPGGEDEPSFGEFLYFAFVVGCTFQVSDATTNTPRMRRIVLLHGMTAFWFNTVILASAVSTVLSLAG
ncbi:DUF1345 domain-containing protein [Roseococcus pinisoli]|uniref:DUF1345 domain-containing protein n=1 Tax=Roseococcus pinisoli TaxID=2835040 RepID=A0ABS5Q916_9PROT|nr:DUF1345 domain-containing protein [Roseococcus pinisoli]MBS7809957.1 DUF1345 domain-containing protein [Roseococcus pinisoli]